MTYKTLESVIREMRAAKKPTEEEAKELHKKQQIQKQIIDNP